MQQRRAPEKGAYIVAGERACTWVGPVGGGSRCQLRVAHAREVPRSQPSAHACRGCTWAGAPAHARVCALTPSRSPPAACSSLREACGRATPRTRECQLKCRRSNSSAARFACCQQGAAVCAAMLSCQVHRQRARAAVKRSMAVSRNQNSSVPTGPFSAPTFAAEPAALNASLPVAGARRARSSRT